MLGPALLVALGVVLLLLELGAIQWSAAFGWMARWWPLVLVGAGVVLLGEWFFDTRRAGTSGAAPPRRALGSSGVLVLMLLVLAGPAVSGVYRGSDWARNRWHLPASWDLEQLLAQHSETIQELSAPLNPGGLLTIQNYHGNVTVTGSSQDGQIHVTAHQRLWAWQQSELKDRQQHDRPVLEGGNASTLLRVAGEGRDETDLTVEVPHESALRIGAEKGEVEVSELRGALTVADHEGNVTLTALNGEIHLSVRDDDSDISGHSLSGGLTLDGRAGDISLTDVTGPVALRGDFFGTTHLEHVGGPVHFGSSFTDFACASLPGEMNVEGRSELRAHGLIGPMTLSTTDRDISLTDIHNSAMVTNRKGSVTLSFLDLIAPVSVATTDGSIEVHVPEKAAFHVTAETADGDIENDLGLSPQKQGDRVALTGQVRNGGPTIHLQTTEGDIKLRKGALGSQDAERIAPAKDENDDKSSD